MPNPVNGKTIQSEHPVVGYVRDPENPQIAVLVEQFPPCLHRKTRLKHCCNGRVLTPYCTQMSTFLVTECVHCSILAEHLRQHQT